MTTLRLLVALSVFAALATPTFGLVLLLDGDHSILSGNSATGLALATTDTSVNLSHSGGGANGIGVYINFSSQDLSLVGSAVTLQFDVSFASGSQAANAFRFLLGSSNANPPITTTGYADFPVGYSGLGGGIQANNQDLASGSSGRTVRTTLTDTDSTLLGTLSSTFASGVANPRPEANLDIGGLAKTVKFTVERIAAFDGVNADVRTTLDIIPDASLGRPAVTAWTYDNVSATADDFDNFNMVKFGLWNATATNAVNFTVSNLSITTVPEPGAWAAVLGSLVWAWTMCRRHRRR